MQPSNVSRQLESYKGILGWKAEAGKWPDIEIPLFIKNHPIPVRKPKITEINTVSVVDPMCFKEIGTAVFFAGTPDRLQLNLDGWLITPRFNKEFVPVDTNGAPLSFGNVTYGEIISAFIQGQMEQTPNEVLKRRDPDYYISPYGHEFLNPIIGNWSTQYSPVPIKQPFSLTLYLEY